MAYSILMYIFIAGAVLKKINAYKCGKRDKQKQYYLANPKNPYNSESERGLWMAYNSGFNSNPPKQIQGELF